MEISRIDLRLDPFAISCVLEPKSELISCLRLSFVHIKVHGLRLYTLIVQLVVGSFLVMITSCTWLS